MNIQTLKIKLINYGGLFDPEQKQKRVEELEKEVSREGFWENLRKSEAILQELNTLKNLLAKTNNLKQEIETNLEMALFLKNNIDLEIQKILEEELLKIKDKVDSLEVEIVLDGPYDKGGAILEIHAGAGGTEAQDWAEMLERMYLRFCDRRGFSYDIMDEQKGEEAGIKSSSILVKGLYAFGYLKSEKGIHRLIRLSPFNANNKRQTSFASIDITPMIDQNIELDIKESDLRIDVYRSSGCGGQGVNTTDSAVRITHLPTKIVVTCQNERSQIQNKEKAMEVLKSKLYQLEIEKKEEELKKIKGTNMEINFGSQIRTYTMHPYSLVKDHRTNIENTNVGKVMDGDIDVFVEEYLRKCRN